MSRLLRGLLTTRGASASPAAAVQSKLDALVEREARQRKREALAPARARSPIPASLGVADLADIVDPGES